MLWGQKEKSRQTAEQDAVFIDLERVAKVYDGWQEVHEYVTQDNEDTIRLLFDAAQEQHRAGATDKAKFFALRAAEYFVNYISPQASEEKIDLLIKTAHLLYTLNQEREAFRILDLAEAHLLSSVQETRARHSGGAAVPFHFSQLSQLLSLANFYHEHQKHTRTQLVIGKIPFDKVDERLLFRLLPQIAPHFPDLACSFVDRIHTKLEHDQDEYLLDQLISEYDDVTCCVATLQSLLHHGRITEVDQLLKQLIRTQHRTEFAQLLPVLARNKVDIVEFLQAFEQDLSECSIRTKQFEPLLIYFAETGQLDLLFMYLPEYSVSPAVVEAVARRFLSTHHTLAETLQALAQYRDTKHKYVVDTFASATIKLSGGTPEQTDHAMVMYLELVEATANDGMPAITNLLFEWALKTHGSEQSWVYVKKYLNTETNFDYFFSLLLDDQQCTQSDSLLHRVLAEIETISDSQRSRLLLQDLFRMYYRSGKNLPAVEQLVMNTHAIENSHFWSADRRAQALGWSVFPRVSVHSQIVTSDLQKRLFSQAAELSLQELETLTDTQKAYPILQLCWASILAHDTERAQKIFVDNKAVFLISQKEIEEQCAYTYVATAIHLGEYAFVQPLCSTHKWRQDEQFSLLTDLCEHGYAASAVSLYRQWYGSIDFVQSKRDYTYADRLFTDLIKAIGASGRKTILNELAASLPAEALTLYLPDFVSAGMNELELVALGTLPPEQLYQIYEAVYYYHKKHGNLSEAAEVLAHLIPLIQATRPPFRSGEYSSLIKQKCLEEHKKLIARLMNETHLPQAIDSAELKKKLKKTKKTKDIPYLAQLLRAANLDRDDRMDILYSLTNIHTTNASIDDTSTSAITSRLTGVLDQQTLQFATTTWQLDSFGSIWKQGFPHLLTAQAENIVRMASIERARPGITEFLKKRFGVHCFSRVPDEVWIAMYDAKNENKPWGIVFFSRADHNGALNKPLHWQELYNQLNTTHTLVCCEVDSLEAIGRYLQRAYIMYGKKQTDESNRRCSFVIIDWHGSENSGRLQPGYRGILTADTVVRHSAATVFRNRYIATDSVPLLSLGCKTGVNFAREVGTQLRFTQSSGPQESTSLKSIKVVYQPGSSRIASLQPTFEDGPSLSYNDQGTLLVP